MPNDLPLPQVPVQDTTPAMRKAWRTPVIEDADIGAFTAGGGTSGVEGTPFLKTGS